MWGRCDVCGRTMFLDWVAGQLAYLCPARFDGLHPVMATRTSDSTQSLPPGAEVMGLTSISPSEQNDVTAARVMDQAIEAAGRALYGEGWDRVADQHYRETIGRAIQAAAPILKAEHEREVLQELADGMPTHDGYCHVVEVARARGVYIDLGEGE